MNVLTHFLELKNLEKKALAPGEQCLQGDKSYNPAGRVCTPC